MSAVPTVLRALYEGERAMERKLLETAARDAAEHEVHHVAIDLARWSHEHAERLARAAEPYGLRLPAPSEGLPGPGERRERAARALDDARSGLDLLNDLRALHLAATGNSLDWEMLAQAAQAEKDTGLLDLATACHPQTLRQMRWTNTMIKTLSPQLLSRAGTRG
ncbi:hypothetical protein ACFYY9_30315 [Streptomyces nigra]|uniref:hypothetical protein n=1 Tax=Streptomyces TaxID=1883 RepID=UPI0006E1E33D|nr:hypothetical protein [Streptomyces sp. JHA19]